MIRLLDITLAGTGLILLAPILMLLYLAGMFDTGSPLFVQQRLGRNQKPFKLVKFRTMSLGTATVASHMLDSSVITGLGGFLRRAKLDELPQLWNVLKGEMSLVGPRPCLPCQREVIAERGKRRVFDVRPGITGLAQINNIDMSTPVLLAETDQLMVKDLSVFGYFAYIVLTVTGKGKGDVVSRKK